MYCSIGGRYERASVTDCEIVTSWSRFPFASFLSVIDNRTAIRSPTNLGPLVADFFFNHSSCNRFRFEIHDCAPLPPAGYVYDLDLIPPTAATARTLFVLANGGTSVCAQRGALASTIICFKRR
jgi:hypothetical protein